MEKPKLCRPSPALVVACLALVVALVGTAAAAPKTKVMIRKGEIARGAVGAKALAEGAVHLKALAGGAVSAPAIKPGAVGASALAPDSGTAPAITPGSVCGGTLGEVTLRSAPTVDVDTVPHNSEWTLSEPVAVQCAASESVLAGGAAILSPGNDQVNVIASQPLVDGGQNGWVDRIISDFGGLAKAEVKALRLK